VSQALGPRETRVCTLGARKDSLRGRGGSGSLWQSAPNVHTLGTHQLQTGASVFSATPISPEEWREANRERMEQQANPPWLDRGLPMPLTLGAAYAAAAIADSGTVEDTQAAIRFPALFGGMQHLALRALEHPVRLEGEIVPRKATCLPGQGDSGCAVPLRWCLLGSGIWIAHNGWGKLGRAQWLGLELMAQFESQVPGPLRDHLPGFLSPGRMTAPPVGIKLDVFIEKSRLKRPPDAGTARPHRGP
jgi:hypothetical protein